MVGIKRGNGRLRSRPLWARGAVSFTCDQENDRAFGIPIGDLRWLRELKCQCSPILIWTLALPSMSHQKLQLEISRVGEAKVMLLPPSRLVANEACFPGFKRNMVTDSLEPKIPVSSANKNHVNCKRKKNGIKRIPYAKVALQVNSSNHPPFKKEEKEEVKGLEKGCLSRNGGDTAEERELSAILENHSETLSESLSVSGIIKKYFSDYEEVGLSSNFTSRANQSQRKKRLTTRTDSNCLKSKVSGISQFTPKTPPRVLPFPLSTDLSSKTSRNIVKRTGVGNRLVVASNNLGISVKSATGLCRFGDRKLSVPKSSSFVRSIVFEISDSDE
ncbi:hypothetical protein HYC85_011554 [Camellia sinensis]|uniref:Uncharacterized protein n=1 Tax=Camellia sinensis TaxID=4442 RepID=A0A7J7HBB8_CAMSI|nr:hypothetical protein HYC85_011554 [Camellia sinensis]